MFRVEWHSQHATARRTPSPSPPSLSPPGESVPCVLGRETLPFPSQAAPVSPKSPWWRRPSGQRRMGWTDECVPGGQVSSNIETAALSGEGGGERIRPPIIGPELGKCEPVSVGAWAGADYLSTPGSIRPLIVAVDTVRVSIPPHGIPAGMRRLVGILAEPQIIRNMLCSSTWRRTGQRSGS